MTNTGQRIRQKVKSHIPKDWLTEIRITYRILMETAKGISQTGLINVAIITTMAAILTIFGVLFRFTLSLSTFASELGNVLEISVYLKNEVYEFGVNLGPDATSRANGSVGGEITKRLVKLGENQLSGSNYQTK